MGLKISHAAGDALAAALKTALDGGILYLFAGPVPATAGEALDMGADHTEVVKITESDDGSTGLTFEAAVDGLLAKEGDEEWLGTAAFDGAEDGEANLSPTFYRFCTAADNGRGLANETTGHRIQGTVGGPSSGADLVLQSGSVANSAEVPIGAFSVRIGPAD